MKNLRGAVACGGDCLIVEWGFPLQLPHIPQRVGKMLFNIIIIIAFNTGGEQLTVGRMKAGGGGPGGASGRFRDTNPPAV